MGEEDSIRLVSKKGKKVDLKRIFEELINENDFLTKKSKKRIKQGDSQNSGMSYDFAQNQLNLLRRKEAENIPRMEIKNIVELNEKRKNFKEVEHSVNLRKTSDQQFFKKDFSFEIKKDENFDSSLKGKSISNHQSTSLTFKSYEKEKERIFEKVSTKSQKENENFESFKISKEKDFINSGGKKNKIENEDFISKNSKENNIVHEKKSGDKILFENFSNFFNSSDFQVLNNDSYINDLTGSIINHLAKNISQLYSYSLDKTLNSLDLLSIRNFQNGFAFKMKLYPEELGELELFVKKEGLNLSLVAYVLNEEAKTVMMKDSEHLTNFLMNQGYNLDQLMVEVKSDDKDREFKNFDKILAENNKNFNSNQNSIEYEDNKRNFYNFKRFSYHKGIGRYIDKYV